MCSARPRSIRLSLALGVSTLAVTRAPLAHAQAGNTTGASDIATLIAGVIAIVVLGIAGFLLAQFIRKRITHNDDQPASGFSLDALRKMHRRGELSDEEFERAKQAMLSSVSFDKNPVAAAREARLRAAQHTEADHQPHPDAANTPNQRDQTP